MNLTNLLPSESLSSTEIGVVKEALSLPAVKKYLRVLAQNDANELLELSALANDKEKLLRAHAIVYGKLQVLSTLLSITESPTTPA